MNSQSHYINTYLTVAPEDRKQMYILAEKYSPESIELLNQAELYLDKKADLKYNQTRLSSLRHQSSSRVDLEISRLTDEISILTTEINNFETLYSVSNTKNEEKESSEIAETFNVQVDDLSEEQYDRLCTELELLKDEEILK